jgi:hypothetical protein
MFQQAPRRAVENSTGRHSLLERGFGTASLHSRTLRPRFAVLLKAVALTLVRQVKLSPQSYLLEPLGAIVGGLAAHQIDL